MTRTEKLSRLKSMLAQVAPDGHVEELTRRPRPAAWEGLEAAGEEAPSVDTALGKLEESRFDELTEREFFALEAIVLPRERPVVFVRGDAYDDIEAPWTHLNDETFRAKLGPLFRSIGRVELPNMPWIPYAGTAFVVGPNLLMTNRHVAKHFTEGVGTRIRYRAGDAGLNFRQEVDFRDEAMLSVRRVEMIHPYWDMALLAVDGLEGHPSLVLSVKTPEELAGLEVAVIGYPARDDRNDLAVQNSVFKGVFNVKRLQPGMLRARQQIRSFDNVVNALTHDSSTLGGNSGSAVIDVQTGHVVGLHFAGIYLKSNYAVPVHELARDRRVVSKGLNFGGSVAASNDWEPAWLRVEGESPAADVVAPPTPPARPDPPAVAPPQRRVAPAAGPGGPGWTVWEIPLRVAVSLGAPGVGGPSAVAPIGGVPVAPGPAGFAGLEAFPMQVPKIFGNLEQRTGFRRNFLGLAGGANVPMPQLTALGKQVAAKLDDDSLELKYHKFSVFLHKGRRLALLTAANVDWRPEKRTVNGHKPTRKELTEIPDNVAEQWVTDFRISQSDQLPDIFFTEDGGAFDKGHLVRRDDVCWGSSFKDIQKGNGDTYHTPNCSPQVKGFNQAAQGEDNWGDLENLVQKQTKAERSVIYSGPVFAEDDPLFEGRTDDGTILLRIPRKFWKAIVIKGAAGAEAYAFTLEQDLSGVPVVEEFTVPENWVRHMCSIADLEELSGGLLDFSALEDIDQFDSTEGMRVAEAVEGPGVLARTTSAAGELEAVRSDFEVERAIGAYIPLLRAAYDFAHGNENPPVPDGYEIVAKLQASAEEGLEALPAMSPEARVAVANDFLAMAREERPVGPEEGIASPNAFGFVIREKLTGAFIVSVRGTQTPGEWLKNFTAIPNPFSEVPGFGAVHLGFELMWRRVRGSMIAALDRIPVDARITFLGHSLGGAMVTLGAVDIKKNFGRENVDVCTFGGPRAGQIRFRVKFNKLIERCFRVAEGRDIVPKVPPRILLWNHVGLEIPVRSKADNPHSLDSYLEGLNGLRGAGPEAPGAELVGPGEIAGFRTL